jgi:DNA-binding response OmpR family regulator
MCCDDDQEILNLVSQFFMMRGHQVEISESAFGLSKKIADFKPDVLLLDHRMPGLSGESFVNVFQHTGTARSVPIIFYSAEDREKLAPLVARLGVVGWIPKTVIGMQLVNQVERLLSIPA